MQLTLALVAALVPSMSMAAALPQTPDITMEVGIVGGELAAAGDFPFIVSLSRSGGSHFCGGTLLNANTVLTAAHCSVGQSASNVQVRAGSKVSYLCLSFGLRNTIACSGVFRASWKLKDKDSFRLTTAQKRNSGGTIVGVSRITVHPSYSSSTYNNDVAIWRLSTSIPTSSTISYASLAASGSDPAAGSSATVAGW